MTEQTITTLEELLLEVKTKLEGITPRNEKETAAKEALLQLIEEKVGTE